MPSYSIEHVMKTPELTDEQRAGILGRQRSQAAQDQPQLALRQRDDAGVQ